MSNRTLDLVQLCIYIYARCLPLFDFGACLSSYGLSVTTNIKRWQLVAASSERSNSEVDH